MVKGIVEDISSKLAFTQATCFDDLVCMEGHTEQMVRLLEIESEGETRIVGIWGMGGIGKTTIAKYLYEQFTKRFSAQCFMENIDKKNKTVDLKGLQKQFLCDLLRTKRMALKNEQHGARLIQTRLENLKVFVVLDGVDRVEQIYALAREARWFGKGSRIIITTRDKRLLDSYSNVIVVNKYNVKCLGSEDSLKMFKHFAFNSGVPPFNAFDERLAIRASRLAHGLPIALEALGKYFRGTTSITQWEADIATFETAPHQNIIDVLIRSYNNLNDTTKLTFLRIACLFNGEPVSRVSAILGTSIGDLADKSLFHISNDRCIDMHSLIQQMGREIVIKKSKFKPQKQSILWDPLNSYGVLLRNTGTENIEGMALHMCELSRKSLPINGSAFNQMHNLKFLKLFKHHDVIESNWDLTSGNCISFPLDLRLLHWDAYPLTTLPPHFPLDFLVELHLRHSNLESLWDGNPSLKTLKILDVTGSKNLIKLPDLSSAPKLEELIMKGCTRMGQLLETTDKLTTLRKIDASYCDDLMNLEMTIREFPDLENSSYEFFQYQVAKKFPDVAVVANTDSLKNLSIQCQLNFQLGHLEGKAAHLSFSSEQHIHCALTVSKTQKMCNLYTDFYSCKSLDIMQFNYNKDDESFMINSFLKFVSLTELNLINLKIHNIPNDIGSLRVLQKLDLSGNDFQHLPDEMENLSNLRTLYLNNCNNLKSLTELPLSLKYLYAHGCKSLETFSLSIDHSLNELDLSNSFHWEKDSSQITWFPGRSNEEAHRCASCHETKMSSTNQVKRSPISIPMQHLKSFLWVFVIYFMVVGVELILHKNEIVRYSARTSIIVHACLNSLAMSIFLCMRL